MNQNPIYGGYTAERFYNLPAYLAADGWQCKGRLVGPAAVVDIDTQYFTADGATWTLNWPPAQTAPLLAGSYTLQIVAFDGTGRELPAAREPVAVFAANATDLRSPAKKILDALTAALEGRASKTDLSMSHNGRSIGRMTHDDLQTAIKKQTRRVSAQEARANGRPLIQSVLYRFSQ